MVDDPLAMPRRCPLVDYLFPDSCLGCRGRLPRPMALPLCPACRPEQGLLDEQQKRPHPGVEAMFAYDGPLAATLMQLKFGRQTSLAGPLGRILAEHDLLAKPNIFDCLTAVPLHRQRQWSRGFNQSALILHWAVHHVRHGRRPVLLPPPLVDLRCLSRTRATIAQSRLPATLRRGNMSGAFAADPRRCIGRTLLVIDDVTTTGATLEACRRALLDAGATSATGLALMHST